MWFSSPSSTTHPSSLSLRQLTTKRFAQLKVPHCQVWFCDNNNLCCRWLVITQGELSLQYFSGLPSQRLWKRGNSRKYFSLQVPLWKTIIFYTKEHATNWKCDRVCVWGCVCTLAGLKNHWHVFERDNIYSDAWYASRSIKVWALSSRWGVLAASIKLWQLSYFSYAHLTCSLATHTYEILPRGVGHFKMPKVPLEILSPPLLFCNWKVLDTGHKCCTKTKAV